MTRITPAALARWRRDPIVFVREALIDPETGQPFERHKVRDGAERYLQVLFLWTGNSSSVGRARLLKQCGRGGCGARKNDIGLWRDKFLR